MSALNGVLFFFGIFSVAFAIMGWIGGAFIFPRDKMGDKGVELPFKVFLALYAKAPEKWICLEGSARYGDQQVFFPSAHEWRKYNRWRKRREKLQEKEAEDKRKDEFLEGILREYEPKMPPPPTSGTNVIEPKPKTDKYSVELYRTLDGNAYIGKVLDAVQERECPNDGKCQNCEYLRFEHQLYRDTERLVARCEKPKAMNKTDPEQLRKAIEEFLNSEEWRNAPIKVIASGLSEPKVKDKNPLETVQTYPLRTTEHYE